MSICVSIVRSALAFVERQDGRCSLAILAANAAFILAAIVLVNVWTLLSIATAIVPAVKGLVTPIGAISLGIILWFVIYRLVRRQLMSIDLAESRSEMSSRPIVLYAVVSIVALLAATALLLAFH